MCQAPCQAPLQARGHKTCHHTGIPSLQVRTWRYAEVAQRVSSRASICVMLDRLQAQTLCPHLHPPEEREQVW